MPSDLAKSICVVLVSRYVRYVPIGIEHPRGRSDHSSMCMRACAWCACTRDT